MFLRFVLLVFAVLVAVSCSDEDPVAPAPQGPQAYADLTDRDEPGRYQHRLSGLSFFAYSPFDHYLRNHRNVGELQFP